MELDAMFRGKSKKGKGKGNKKGGIKYYSYSKIGHIKKDYHKNTVQRQINMMQQKLIEFNSHAQGAYVRTQNKVSTATDPIHALKS